jgi:membrane protein DedA with SNARE-associated domain
MPLSESIMMVESFIETYGYLAILVGTFLEGETILVLGGFAAHQGYLALPWVILAAFMGTFCGDQIFFYLGRNYGAKILARRPSWQIRAEKAQKLLERFQTLLIFLFRFLYGLRSITPVVIGMSSVSKRRFFLINALGAFVWAVAVGSGGYLFGHALGVLMGDLKRYEIMILAVTSLAGASVWALHFYRRRKNKPSP